MAARARQYAARCGSDYFEEGSPFHHSASEVASGAVFGGVTLTVAGEARPHRVPHSALRYGHLFHFTMACLALDLGPDMGSVLELHLGFRLECVHTFPGHFAPPFGVDQQLLHPGAARGEFRMTQHALANRRQSGCGFSINSDMAIDAIQAISNMLVGRK